MPSTNACTFVGSSRGPGPSPGSGDGRRGHIIEAEPQYINSSWLRGQQNQAFDRFDDHMVGFSCNALNT